MVNRFGELVTSPYDEEPRSPKRRVLSVSLGVVAVVVVGVVSWIAFGGDDVSTETQQSGTAISSSTSSTTTLPAIPLVSYESDPRLLYHPTVLPFGWETCRVLEDASKGDRFCNPEDSEEWLQISLKEFAPAVSSKFETAPLTGDDNGGRWFDQGERTEVAYLSGGRLITVMTRGSVTPEFLVEIAASIPLVSDLDSLTGEHEASLALDEVSDAALVSLLADFGDVPSVTRRGGSFQVRSGSLTLSAVPTRGFFVVPNIGADIPQPRLVPSDRPLVVGESESRGRAFAVWDQSGFGWSFEGQLDAKDAAAIAITLIERISALSNVERP